MEDSYLVLIHYCDFGNGTCDDCNIYHTWNEMTSVIPCTLATVELESVYWLLIIFLISLQEQLILTVVALLLSLKLTCQGVGKSLKIRPADFTEAWGSDLSKIRNYTLPAAISEVLESWHCLQLPFMKCHIMGGSWTSQRLTVYHFTNHHSTTRLSIVKVLAQLTDDSAKLLQSLRRGSPSPCYLCIAVVHCPAETVCSFEPVNPPVVCLTLFLWLFWE